MLQLFLTGSPLLPFKRTTKKAVHAISEAIAPQDTSDLVKQIHNEFYTAHSFISDEDVSTGERLYKLGFTSTPEAKRFHTIQIQKNWYEAAKKYSVFYPNNKFISWEQVYRICNKYGLEKTSVGNYTGIIPEKNLREMEEFKIRDEDAFIKRPVPITKEEYDLLPDSEIDCFAADDAYYKYITSTERHGFSICAPQKNISIPDPIVLQGLEDGYLIVTAWGDEASDENVVNEKMN